MTLHPPIWQQNNAYPALRDRQVAHSFVDIPGVRDFATDLDVTQRSLGTNMSVDVAPGRAVVLGTDVSDQGKYLVHSDAVTNVVIAAAPGSGQERIDLVVAQVRDSAVIGGVNDDWVLVAVTGTPAATGTAVEPTPPASTLVLARIFVQANVTQILDTDITDRRKRMALLRRPDEARGVIPGAAQILGTSGDALAGAPTNSDFVLNGVPVRADRDYRVHLHSRFSVSAAADWELRFKVNGVTTDLLDRHDVVTGADQRHTNAVLLWLPVSDATVNLLVDVLRVTGTGTLTFQATGSAARQFWVEDCGPRFPVPGL